MSETNAMSLFDRMADPMAAIEKMGKFLALSGMFGCEKVEQGMVIALACLCERKSPLEIMRHYHIIENKLSMRAEAMLAAFLANGGKIKWLNVGDDGKEARAVFTPKGGDALELAFSIEDAKRMKVSFVGKNGGATQWTKNPGAMMRARLISKSVRMLDPGAVTGTYTPEEIMDFDNLKDAAPEPEQALAGAPKLLGKVQPAPIESAPTAPAKAEPEKRKPAPEPKAEKPQTEPAVTNEAQQAVAAIMAEAKIEEAGLTWLRANKFIGEKGTVLDMSVEDAERMASKPSIFIRYVNDGRASKPLKGVA